MNLLKLSKECADQMAMNAMLRQSDPKHTVQKYLEQVREQTINDCIDELEKIKIQSPHVFIERLRAFRDKK